MSKLMRLTTRELEDPGRLLGYRAMQLRVKVHNLWVPQDELDSWSFSACCLECWITWSWIVRGSPLNWESMCFISLFSDKMAPAHRPKYHRTILWVPMKVKKMFLASRFDSFNEEFLLIVLRELEGPYSWVCPALVYFWAFPETSEHSLCTTNSCLSSMLPCLFFFPPP